MHLRELDRFGVVEAEVMLESDQATHYAGRLEDGRQVVLKVLSDEGVLREGAGLQLLARYSGVNSVEVLAQGGRAVLMERLGGEMLIERWRAGESAAADVAIGLVCAVHGEAISPEGLLGLDAHFAAALAWNFSEAAAVQEVLRGLQAKASEDVALHGDVHPRNIMRREVSWCLIDPIGLRGPKAFDYANMFLNPWDFAGVHRDAGRVVRLAGKVSAACGASPQDVLGWAAANALWWAEVRARRGLGAGYPLEMVRVLVGASTHPT